MQEFEQNSLNPEEFQKIVNQLQILIWKSNTEGLRDYFSPAWLNFTGNSMEQEIGNAWMKALHPDDYDNYRKTYLDSFNTHLPFEIEYRLKRHDGKYRWMLDKAVPNLNSNGEFQGYIGTCFDITKQKQTEEALRESNTLYESLVNQLPQHLYRIDLEGKVLFVNQSLQRNLGVPLEDILGKTAYDFYPEELAHKYRQDDMEIVRTNKTLNLIEENISPNTGEKSIVAVTKIPVCDDKGNICEIQGVFQEITERSKAEEELVNSKVELVEAKKKAERIALELKEAQKVASLGSWYLDSSTNEVTWSEELFNIYGYDIDAQVPTYREFKNLSTPESWEKLTKTIEKALETGMPYELELEFLRKDKSSGWMWAKGEPIFDNSKNIIGIRGVSQDITERKQMELKLIKTKEKAEENGKLLKAVAENFPNSYLSVIEKDFTVGFTSGQEFINQGINPNDYIGLKIEQVFGEQANTVIKEYQKTFNGKENSFELSINNQYQLFRTVPLYDENKEITKILAVSENITEQKQRELELQQAREKAEENEKRLLFASKSAQLGIFDWNIKDNTLIWDDRMFELYGQSKDITHSPFELWSKHIHPDDEARIAEEVENALQGIKDFSSTFKVIHSNGEVLYIKGDALVQRDEDGNAKRMIGINRDITESKIKKNMLEFKNKQLIDFSNIVAHNLRGPLINIEMLVDAIETNSDVEKQKLFISHLKPVITHLNEVFNELVESLQIKQDTEITIEKIVLNERLNKTLIGFEGQITSSQAEISIDFTDAPIIYYPKKYIDSIFSNLVGNALKYKSPDRKPIIQIRTERLNNEVLLSIKDNGLGIDMSLAKDKLFKIRKTFHNHPDARGFGLFMIKTQIDTMGGEIWVDSTLGKGSTFYVKFKNQK